jgi:glycosyltransferase involved in cell wall biosynthesis
MCESNSILSVIVPCFNEEASIPLFYQEVTRILAELIKAKQISSFELIFVDDGSFDKTAEILKQLAENEPAVYYILLSRNFGKEAAMLAGLSKAKGQYITILDADLQDPPALLPQMLDAVVNQGFDCAGTRRVTRKGEPMIRSFFARRFYTIMLKISDIEIVDGARDFRLMSRKYANAILSLQEKSRFSKGIFPWVGFKTQWFEYENVERKAGETKWSFWKLFMYSLEGIINFSSKPLAIASFMGILFFFLSIIFIVLIATRKILYGDPVTGWASTICVILFCSGIQLFSIGILGQYLAKTYIEVKQRPNYIVMEENIPN